jgi:hypothetical protein
VCRQSGGVHDVVQLVWSKIYTQLRTRDIFSELVLEIGGLEVRPYFLRNATYPSCPNLFKSFKPSVNDHRF